MSVKQLYNLVGKNYNVSTVNKCVSEVAEKNNLTEKQVIKILVEKYKKQSSTGGRGDWYKPTDEKYAGDWERKQDFSTHEIFRFGEDYPKTHGVQLRPGTIPKGTRGPIYVYEKWEYLNGKPRLIASTRIDSKGKTSGTYDPEKRGSKYSDAGIFERHKDGYGNVFFKVTNMRKGDVLSINFYNKDGVIDSPVDRAGQAHPAVTIFNNSGSRREEWYSKGELHRDNDAKGNRQPAVIESYDSSTHVEFWKHGEFSGEKTIYEDE